MNSLPQNVPDRPNDHWKTCSKCGIRKAEDDFTRVYGKPGSWCKACLAADQRARYWRDPEKYRARSRGSLPAYAARPYDGPPTKTCVTCGEEKPVGQFQHAYGWPRPQCKDCRAIQTKARYWAEPEKYRARNRVNRPHLDRKLPVPTQTPPITLIYYTAGLLDGEGCIYRCGKTQGRNPVMITLTQGAANDGLRVLGGLAAEWGVGAVGSGTAWPPRLPVYVWRIHAVRHAAYLLRAVLPALRIKTNAALEALAILDEMGV